MTLHAGRSAPGAHIDAQGLAHFTVWAPEADTVEIVSPDGSELLLALERSTDGYFAGAAGLQPGVLYKIRVDGTDPWPDPCSRFQPAGPHGPSQLVQPDRFQWSDDDWPGVSLNGQVVYELHVGAFTKEGTFDAAREHLAWLRDVGITLIELMPIAEFPGAWNWGYDGVQLYAPYHGYGDPQALQRFVDAAHAIGLGVILDVVFNHFGPDGNYLGCFSRHYTSERHCTDWGAGLNYDGPLSNGMRDLVVENVAYWVREFHVDGFRLDATQAITDDSEEHVVAQLVRRARQAAAPRTIVFMEENEPQHASHLDAPACGGWGIDAMWNDDFHHVARVALTGLREGYYHDYMGRPQELISALRHGFLYQGQHYSWQKRTRGRPLPRTAGAVCVHFLQNHDQVGNTVEGKRLTAIADAGDVRAMTALWLLSAQTPLFFMGQEFACSRPFHYFADHAEPLAAAVRDGRRQFMKQFRAFAQHGDAVFRDPGQRETFEESKLDWHETRAHQPAVDLHRDLLRIRRADPIIAAQNVACMDGAVLAERALVLRWYGERGDDRLLVLNLADELVFEPAPEPLLAPPQHGWTVHWSSDDERYAGSGVRSPVNDQQQWRLPGHAAILLRAAR